MIAAIAMGQHNQRAVVPRHDSFSDGQVIGAELAWARHAGGGVENRQF
ncbi:hypothetical protein ACLRDC_11070 [Gluconacetobacter sacchari]|uniref:Uncharacterized protein n=1 Tax=Gluconacetobacter sacchari TaxID=92759 RepID=A0A7W4I9Q5_9PROT|nr:hypothetical protein [Gluconacetobacter sacchari]MBB2158809.1 hypothetical protein [Gluconacetobacter sacchari]